MRDVDAFLGQLFALDDALGRKGFRTLSPWWRETIADFYTGDATTAVVRKGRRVGASTIVAPRLAIAEAMFGGHDFAPGEEYDVIFVSVRRPEAAKRIRNIQAALDALGIAHEPGGEANAIRLVNSPVRFVVLAANHKTAVGDTAIFLWLDEVSRWTNDSASANPAEDVVASLSPTIATMPDARMWLVSSPLGEKDYHATRYDLGNVAGQRVYFGETWIINPTLSKERTKELEPDPRKWAREYAAIPTAGGGLVFDSSIVDPAIKRWKSYRNVSTIPGWGDQVLPGLMAIDASSGGDNYPFGYASMVLPVVDEPWAATRVVHTAHAAAHEYQPKDQPGVWLPLTKEIVDSSRPTPILYLHEVDAIMGRFDPTTSTGAIKERVLGMARRWRCRKWFCDQHGVLFLADVAKANGIRLEPLAWTHAGGQKSISKPIAIERLRDLMRDGTIAIPPNRNLRKGLLELHEKFTPSGALTYASPGKKGIDDFVSVLAAACGCELRGDMPGSHHYVSGQKHIVTDRLPSAFGA